MPEIIAVLGDNDVTRFILSKFGELNVSARHYRDQLEEADKSCPACVDYLEKEFTNYGGTRYLLNYFSNKGDRMRRGWVIVVVAVIVVALFMHISPFNIGWGSGGSNPSTMSPSNTSTSTTPSHPMLESLNGSIVCLGGD